MKLTFIGLRVLAMVAIGVTPSFAQGRSPKTEVKGTIGIVGYEGDTHDAWGGGFRYYATSRLNAEIEALWVRDLWGRDSHGANGVVVTPSLGVDFRQSPALLVPHGRAGVMVHYDSWLKRDPATPQESGNGERAHKTHTSFGVNLGFRVYIGDRLFVSPDVFIGKDFALKASLSAGYVTSMR